MKRYRSVEITAMDINPSALDMETNMEFSILKERRDRVITYQQSELQKQADTNTIKSHTEMLLDLGVKQANTDSALIDLKSMIEKWNKEQLSRMNELKDQIRGLKDTIDKQAVVIAKHTKDITYIKNECPDC